MKPFIFGCVIGAWVLGCSGAGSPLDAGMATGGGSTGGGGVTGGGVGTGGGTATGGGAATGGGVQTGGGGGTNSGGGTATGGGTGRGGFTVGSSGCQPLTLQANANLNGYKVDRYAWSDGACLPRTAALVRNDTRDPGGSNGGYLRQLTYQVEGGARTVTGTGANGWNGWGYVVNHYSGTADTSQSHSGTFKTLLAGTHHAIHEFKLRMSPGGPVDVTIHWFFATGRTAPIYDIEYDATPAGANAVRADSRAPYGDMAFEGTAGPIGGIGWGDDHRFTTTGAGPVTMRSAWDYTQPNTVPYVRMWSSGVDAEMGAVQTQTFAVRIGGGDYGAGTLNQECQGKTSGNKGPNCSAGGDSMPQDWLWPFQLNQYELPFTDASHRLAWGLSGGSVGQSQVSAFGRTTSGYPKLHYAVALVLGVRSTPATLAQVTEMEHHLAALVTGATWSERFAGWEGPAATGGTTISVNPAGGPISNPVFHLTGFAGARIGSLTVNGAVLVADQGYFATKDASDGSLWLTLNGTVTGPLSVRVE